MLQKITDLLAKVINNVTGLKALILVAGTILLYFGKLPGGDWVNLAIAVVGMRAATDIAAIVKDPEKK